MWRIKHAATSGLAALLLIGMAGCVDLDVKNLNDPDAERALSTPGDVEALIAGGFQAWYGCLYYEGPTMWISNASGEHVAPWGNSGMEMYARIPRIPTSNQAGAANVGTLTYCWYRSYRAIAAVADGLKQIESGAVDLGTEGNLRAKAYGRFIQGLAHGTIAMLYDSGFVYDESIDPETVVLQGYEDVMAASLDYLAEAATLAGTGSFTVPSTWLSKDVPAAELARLARSFSARHRASVARTPADRQAVDWAAVVADVNAGLTSDFDVYSNCNTGTFCDDAMGYRNYYYWQMQNNWVLGMADQSGNYQNWITTPLLEKQPFIIVTPDTRWPQGPDEATQRATCTAPEAGCSSQFYVNSGSSRVWSRPDRGTWRWSYYGQINDPWWVWNHVEGEGLVPFVKMVEMNGLKAEADFYNGALGAVAAYVNQTRTLHGLNATDAAGLNTDCVPKLPNGSCGSLWEMFKWEKRLETQFTGPLRVGFWIDGRGWGDLMEGTILQLPVPYGEMQLLGFQPYNYGGVGGDFAAPVGVYGF